jgi:hypothetical protein
LVRCIFASAAILCRTDSRRLANEAAGIGRGVRLVRIRGCDLVPLLPSRKLRLVRIVPRFGCSGELAYVCNLPAA